MLKRTLLPSLAAGLLGGMLSHYLAPDTVHAQSQAKEVRAGSFVLVNDQGTVLATLGDDNGRPCLKLYDREGREIWSAGGKIGLRSAYSGK